MNAKSIIFGLLIVAAVAALFYFFVVKPKTAAAGTPLTVTTVNTDGTTTTRAMTAYKPRQSCAVWNGSRCVPTACNADGGPTCNPNA